MSGAYSHPGHRPRDVSMFPGICVCGDQGAQTLPVHLAEVGSYGLIEPMLASPTLGDPRNMLTKLEGTHAFELKVDGVRAICYWHRPTASLRIYNRNQSEITHLFPEIVEAFERLRPPSMIVDGEIDLVGPHTFSMLMRRVKATLPRVERLRRELPAHLVAFDVLQYGGQSGLAWPEQGTMTTLPYAKRRQRLEAVIPQFGEGVTLVPASPAGPEFYDAVQAAGGEGLVAKELTSPYLGGNRSKAWRKVKLKKTITCIAVSYEPGKGHRAALGAIHIALVDPEATAPTYVGKVGSGFSDDDVVTMKAALDAGQFPLVEVEAMGRTANDKLRQPVFKGLRVDQTLTDASVAQLELLTLQ